MTDAPLIITGAVLADLDQLRAIAARSPIDVTTLSETLATPRGKDRHREQMDAQTVVIDGPFPFYVTLSIETGHPVGTCRHMSMSIDRENRVPSETAVWMVASYLGFAGGLDHCAVWPEQLTDGGVAINIVQPIQTQEPHRAA